MPFHGRGGEGLGIGVVGRGVEREQDEVAVGAIDLDFASLCCRQSVRLPDSKSSARDLVRVG